MKKMILALSIVITSGVFAATETRSIRTSTDLVAYNDSVGSVIQKLGRPESSHEYTMRDRNGRLVIAQDLYYNINNLKYTITILEGKVFRIIWDR